MGDDCDYIGGRSSVFCFLSDLGTKLSHLPCVHTLSSTCYFAHKVTLLAGGSGPSSVCVFVCVCVLQDWDKRAGGSLPSPSCRRERGGGGGLMEVLNGNVARSRSADLAGKEPRRHWQCAKARRDVEE